MSPIKSRASGAASAASLRPETCVRPVMRRVAPMVRPRRIKSEANVTINEGKRVRLTMVPFR